MILSRRVALGNEHLDEIDDAVVIRGVDTGVAHESVNAVNRMGGFGQRMTQQHWETLEVRVTFAIDVNKRDLARRREVFDRVMAWANRKAWLRTTAQPGKRMYADKVVLPSAGDLRDWTNEYTIVFRAYGVPFWQEVTPATLEIQKITEGKKAFEVGGTVRTVADVTARNISGKTINNLTILVGDSTFTFANLGLGGTETLTISHGNDGLLKIRAGTDSSTRSVFSLRTPESSDDLYVDPGIVTVGIESQRALRVTVKAAGRFVS